MVIVPFIGITFIGLLIYYLINKILVPKRPLKYDFLLHFAVFLHAGKKMNGFHFLRTNMPDRVGFIITFF